MKARTRKMSKMKKKEKKKDQSKGSIIVKVLCFSVEPDRGMTAVFSARCKPQKARNGDQTNTCFYSSAWHLK